MTISISPNPRDTLNIAGADRGPSMPGAVAAPSVQDALERAMAGYELSPDEALQALQATAADVPALMLAASTLRDRAKGRTVTYSRKVFIPLTNLCRDKCGYCTFAKAPNHPDAKTMSP